MAYNCLYDSPSNVVNFSLGFTEEWRLLDSRIDEVMVSTCFKDSARNSL